MAFRHEGPLSAEAEQELMRQLTAGDEDAVRELYSRFGSSIYTLGLRMLGSAQGAEELTQDVFVAAWRKSERFDATRGRLSTWLMAIGHNLAVDRLRHEKGPARPSLVLMDDLPEPPVSDEEGLLDRETARRALDGMTSTERALLRLAYFQGWTAREIAEAQGIPLGTVKTRLRAALIKVRRLEAERERASGRAAERAASVVRGRGEAP
jgi:RNA polymerase sigma-70 factor (ECF subfamily)